MMIKCSTCKQRLEAENFYNNRSRPNGLHTECKPCALSRSFQYRNSERGKLITKIYEQSEHGKIVHKRAKKKYLQTEKGKMSMIRDTQKAKEKYPEKFVARKAVYGAIRSGKLKKRNSCEICHNGPTQGHHEDYAKPLDIIWLCSRCHTTLHKQYKEKQLVENKT